MGSKNDQYLKVDDYNLEGNKKNFQVFLGRIVRAPWKAFASALVFLFLGIFVLASYQEGSVKFSNEWSVWIPAGLAIAVAVAFLALGIWTLLNKEKH